MCGGCLAGGCGGWVVVRLTFVEVACCTGVFLAGLEVAGHTCPFHSFLVVVGRTCPFHERFQLGVVRTQQLL